MLAVLLAALPALQDPAGVEFYATHVRPLLEANCHRCHGAEPERVKGNLWLTHRAGLEKGGDRGELVDSERPARSLILRMIRHEDDQHCMPPTGKLPDEAIATITRWVEMGAPMPEDTEIPEALLASEEEDSFAIDPEEARWWSYQPLSRPVPPEIENEHWIRNPIDRFVLARLEAAGLEPAPESDRRTLLRRATYDLTGLPPTREETTAFLADERPNAWEELIDRLLDSEQYGVKWARHWLDLVRYAETDSYERDRAKPASWRYRDYVVDAFNEDVPLDRFIREQLAGDELEDPTLRTLIATGYYRLGIWDDEPTDTLLAQYDDLDGIVDTTSRVMLGMSMGCARCHEHKKDPIPQEDYYRFLAFFHGIKPYKVGGGNDVTRRNFVRRIPMKTGVLEILSVKEVGSGPPETHVLIRGNPHVPGKRVRPGFPRIFAAADPAIANTPDRARSSGRRTALAEWILRPDNVRTWRIIANRMWQYHFGRGLVRTPNEFGKLGEMPTHPELLDWLATEFLKRGQSLKSMHRLIMTSSAYRMASSAEPRALALDPENDLFWRFDRRRLTAEEIRDTILAVSGELNLKLGGPSVYPQMPREVLQTSSKPDEVWGSSPDEEAKRRSLYIHLKRSLLTPLLVAFDMADTDSSCPVRFVTTQPTQALTMLNSEFLQEYATYFAGRLRLEVGDEPARQVARAFEIALARRPERAEVERGVDLIRSMEEEYGKSADDALSAFCLVVLNLNELVYLD